MHGATKKIEKGGKNLKFLKKPLQKPKKNWKNQKKILLKKPFFSKIQIKTVKNLKIPLQKFTNPKSLNTYTYLFWNNYRSNGRIAFTNTTPRW